MKHVSGKKISQRRQDSVKEKWKDTEAPILRQISSIH